MTPAISVLSFDVAMITILVLGGTFVISVALVVVPSAGKTFRSVEASFLLRRWGFRVLDFIHKRATSGLRLPSSP